MNIHKKIILINYTGRKGGGVLDAYEISKALLEKGEKVIPILSTQIENLKMWKMLGFEKIITIETYTNRFNCVLNTLMFGLRTKKKIIQELKGYAVKAVYSPMISVWSGQINRLFPEARIIVSCHDPIPHSGSNKIEKIFSKNVFQTADEIIVHSKRFEEVVRREYGKGHYISLGPHNMYKMMKKKEKIIEYKKDRINFLFFGRIEKYKGLDILAKAYKNLQKAYTNISLTVIGNGDFSDYEGIYKGLTNVKIINRWIKDEEVESIFQGENIVNICPYKDATQSGVILVAYEYGIPVIATDTGGLPEQVIHGKTGFLIQPDNVDELENAMKIFLKNNNLMLEMKEGIKEYLKSISWGQTAEELIKLI